MTPPAVTPGPWTTALATLGHVKRETIPVAYVPRADFLELLEGVFADAAAHGYDVRVLREHLRPVAATMDRFALSTWMDSQRGCGCLVGEYLVARDVLDREAYVEAFAEAMRTDAASTASVSVEDVIDAAYAPAFADGLKSIGVRIDRALGRALTAHDCRYIEASRTRTYLFDRAVRAVVFLDDQTEDDPR